MMLGYFFTNKAIKAWKKAYPTLIILNMQRWYYLNFSISEILKNKFTLKILHL